MNRKNSFFTAFLLIMACSISTFTAQAGEFFVGLNAGSSSFDGLNDACDDVLESNETIAGLPLTCVVSSDSDTTFSINAGYNFNRYFGIELGYVDMGEYSADLSVSRITATANAEADYTYAGLVLTAPLSEKFSVSARLGGVLANAEVSLIGLSAEVEDETSGFAGASLDYRIVKNVSVQLRYDTLSLADIVSVGVRYHF